MSSFTQITIKRLSTIQLHNKNDYNISTPITIFTPFWSRKINKKMTVVDSFTSPPEYQEASKRFSIIWNDYVQREEDAKFEFINMVKILESNGYTRTKAISKIVSDHKHLKGFSRMTIYRSLPDDMKRKYESSNIIMLPDNSDVSNDTFENLQEIDAKDTIFSTNDDVNNSDEILDIKTLQERNQFLTKTLEKERYEAYETRIQELKKRNKERLGDIAERCNIEISDDDFAGVFVREYQSKDNCRIQEYEFELLYNDEWIIPLKHTTNVTEKKGISLVLDRDKFELYNKYLINQKKHLSVKIKPRNEHSK